MIDGINCKVYGESLQNILHSDKLDFKEYPNRCEAKYKGLIISIYTEPLQACIRGSIHKFKNEGLHNADLFTYKDFVEAIHKLAIELYIYSSDLHIVRFEIGVNVPLSCLQEEYINTIALINNKVPSKTLNSLLVQYQQYTIKIYSKSIQYSQFRDMHILRLEIAYQRKAKLIKDLDKISTLDELLNRKLWCRMTEVLMNLVTQIVFFDYSEIKPKDLTNKECLIFFEWSNPKESDKSKKSRFKKRANDIYLKYSKNRKANEVKEAVSKQLKRMLDYKCTFATN